MKHFLFVVLVVISFTALGQYRKSKPRTSNGSGTLVVSGGMNKYWYGASDIKFSGEGYQFTLAKVRSNDINVPFANNTSFETKTSQLIQAHINLAYYIKNKWALNLGWNRYNYQIKDQQEVAMTGVFISGVDQINNWSGSYNNQKVPLDKSTFDYQHTGINSLTLNIQRTDKLFKVHKKEYFALCTHFSLGAGGIFTNTDFLFAGRQELNVQSFSGLVMKAQMGLRMEFFKRFFIQSSITGAYQILNNIKNSNTFTLATSNQKFSHVSLDQSIGFFWYIRPTNDCNSCPVW